MAYDQHVCNDKNFTQETKVTKQWSSNNEYFVLIPICTAIAKLYVKVCMVGTYLVGNMRNIQIRPLHEVLLCAYVGFIIYIANIVTFIRSIKHNVICCLVLSVAMCLVLIESTKIKVLHKII